MMFLIDPNKGYATIKELKKNSYVVYSFEFTEMNCVYVGLSNNIKRQKLNIYLEKKKLCINFANKTMLNYLTIKY